MNHPATVAAIVAYVRRVGDLMARAGADQRSMDMATMADAIEAGAHLDTAPETRCEARTTAPTGEE